MPEQPGWSKLSHRFLLLCSIAHQTTPIVSQPRVQLNLNVMVCALTSPAKRTVTLPLPALPAYPAPPAQAAAAAQAAAPPDNSIKPAAARSCYLLLRIGFTDWLPCSIYKIALKAPPPKEYYFQSKISMEHTSKAEHGSPNMQI